MMDENWLPLLQLPGGSWAGLLDNEPEQVWVGSHESPKRQLDLERPVGLLPLLERPLSVVLAELEELNERGYATFSSAVNSSLRCIIETAVAMQSHYWVERAVEWMEALGPSLVTWDELDQLIDAHWVPQSTRHQALRIKRQWKKAEL